jgi:hypothetical protein
MNVKSAAKKAAHAAIELYAQEPRVMLADSWQDVGELWRHLATHHWPTPGWKSLRPYVMAEEVTFVADAPPPAGVTPPEGGPRGTLLVTGYVCLQ